MSSNHVLLTYEEVQELEGISSATLHRRKRDGLYAPLKSDRRGKNGKRLMAIPLSQLSDEAQAAWHAKHGESSGQAIVRLAGKRQPERQAGNKRLPGRRRSDGIPLTPDGVPDERAMREWGLDRHADEYARRMRAVGRVRAELKGAEYGDIMAIRERVAAEFGVCAETIRNWRRVAEEKGPAHLVPEVRSDRGNYRTISEDLGRKIRAFFLSRCRPTARQVFECVVKPHAGEEKPSLRTLTRYLEREILPLEAVAFREGKHAYKAKIMPKSRREYPEPGQVFVADHRKFDTFVLDGDRAVRPWVTAIVDWGSGAWVSWRISLRPCAETVCHALRAALLQIGCPEAFYRDNGKEFVANRLGGKAERLRNPRREDLDENKRWPAWMPNDALKSSIWDTLGIRLITALPYHSWSKMIEPMFNSYATRWENLVPGWCGRNAQDRPENLERLIEERRLLTMDQFGEVFSRIVWALNTERPIGERDRPPLAYFQDYEPEVPAAQTLGVLLQDVRTERVQTTGVTIQHRRKKYRYYSPEIARYVGTKIRVAWDPAEPAWITVYTRDERVIAVPLAKDANPLEYGEANLEARRGGKVQRRVLKEIQGDIAEACSLEEADPLGANRMIEGRLERERLALQESERMALPEADAAAAEQEAARARAEGDEQEYDFGEDDAAAWRVVLGEWADGSGEFSAEEVGYRREENLGRCHPSKRSGRILGDVESEDTAIRELGEINRELDEELNEIGLHGLTVAGVLERFGQEANGYRLSRQWRGRGGKWLNVMRRLKTRSGCSEAG